MSTATALASTCDTSSTCDLSGEGPTAIGNRRPTASTRTGPHRDAVEYCAIFTVRQAGSSVAWQRTCFGSRPPRSGEVDVATSTSGGAQKAPIILRYRRESGLGQRHPARLDHLSAMATAQPLACTEVARHLASWARICPGTDGVPASARAVRPERATSGCGLPSSRRPTPPPGRGHPPGRAVPAGSPPAGAPIEPPRRQANDRRRPCTTCSATGHVRGLRPLYFDDPDRRVTIGRSVRRLEALGYLVALNWPPDPSFSGEQVFDCGLPCPCSSIVRGAPVRVSPDPYSRNSPGATAVDRKDERGVRRLSA